MSVAFRRESDEEHLEPSFELPIPPGPNWVTPRGARLIAERVAALEASLAGETDADARTGIARDLRYWNTRRATAEPAPVPAEGEAGIGSCVRFTLNGAPRTVTIVGADEADPAAGRLAFAAPLARALMGGAAGDILPFGGRDDALAILEVEPA